MQDKRSIESSSALFETWLVALYEQQELDGVPQCPFELPEARQKLEPGKLESLCWEASSDW